MTPQERIIRNALEAARNHSASFGEGGKAAAKIYRAEPIDPVDMLYAIAVMANGLAELEDRVA